MQMKKDNIILVDNDVVKEINYFNKSLGNKTIEINDNSSLTINYFTIKIMVIFITDIITIEIKDVQYKSLLAFLISS